MASFEDIGRRVAATREALMPKMSQEELARRVGVTSNTVSRWERGKVQIPRPQLERVAAVFGRPLAYFTGEPNPGLTELDQLRAEVRRMNARLDRLLRERGIPQDDASDP